MPEAPAQDTTAQKKAVAERLATKEEVRALQSKVITPEPEIEAVIAQAAGAASLPSVFVPYKESATESTKEPERESAKEDTRESGKEGTPEIAALRAESIAPVPVAEPLAQSLDLLELAAILDQHKIWVESGGESGSKADLCGVDLSMANLRGASLVQADLRDANLLGTELRGANLMGASLYGAEGLWVGRLGGTNLFDAMLPETVSSFDGAGAVAEVTRSARWFYLLMLAVTVACVGLVGLTTDVRLILDGPAIPVPRYGKSLPMSGFYLGAPILLLILYARFHFLLLRLWGSRAALPVVFRDGQTLEKEGPWYL